MANNNSGFLLNENEIDSQKIDTLLAECRIHKMQLGEMLIQKTALPEEKIYKILSKQFSIPFLTNIRDKIDYDLLRELPIELFKTGRCFPLQSNDKTISILVSDPLDMDIILEVESITGLVAETSLSTPSEIKKMCIELFKGEIVFRESAGRISREYEKQIDPKSANPTLEEIKMSMESEPIVKMVSLIFDEAIEQRASDIHIEPSENNALIRFRIDGMLKQHMELTKWMFLPLTSRIKILADLDIAEKRVPQDGRIRYTSKKQTHDFRVSTLPTHYGEKTVIRLLKHDLSLLELKNLGIDLKELKQIYETIEKPQGMIFVTGPTGSGKSSTLFACLNRIRTKEINITTIENPIEYKLNGINQVQINEKAGVTFSSTLRSILRQDPDVILVGEIRDKETAEIAIQASQTGHLVLSTLHTNDSVSAITRLRDLGIQSFLISSSLLAIMAQRLVRVLCPHCKELKPVAEDLFMKWRNAIGEMPFSEAYFPVGCNKCHFNGFLGRIGVFELITVNDQFRSLISENASEAQLKEHARKQGMKSISQSGIEKIKQGITTPEEVLRVVLVDEFIDERNV